MFGRFRHALTVLLLIQVLIVVVGTLLIIGLMKVNGYHADLREQWPVFLVIMRTWGFAGLLVPLGCVIWLIKRNEDQSRAGSKSLQVVCLITSMILSLYGWGIGSVSLFQSKVHLIPLFDE